MFDYTSRYYRVRRSRRYDASRRAHRDLQAPPVPAARRRRCRCSPRWPCGRASASISSRTARSAIRCSSGASATPTTRWTRSSSSRGPDACCACRCRSREGARVSLLGLHLTLLIGPTVPAAGAAADPARLLDERRGHPQRRRPLRLPDRVQGRPRQHACASSTTRCSLTRCCRRSTASILAAHVQRRAVRPDGRHHHQPAAGAGDRPAIRRA